MGVTEVSVYKKEEGQTGGWVTQPITPFASQVQLNPVILNQNNVGDVLRRFLPEGDYDPSNNPNSVVYTDANGKITTTSSLPQNSILYTNEEGQITTESPFNSNKPVVTDDSGNLKTANLSESSIVVTDANKNLATADFSVKQLTVLKSLFQENYVTTHNNIYRGALLAKSGNASSSETPLFSNITAVGYAVRDGDFSNIYIGDRIITKMDGESNDITFYVVGINWYKDYIPTGDVGSGKGAAVKPHLCLFPSRHLPNSAVTIGNNSTGFKGTNIFNATKRGNNSLADRIDSALDYWTINSNRWVTNNTDNSNGEWISSNSGTSGVVAGGTNIFVPNEVELFGYKNFTSHYKGLVSGEKQLPGFRMISNILKPIGYTDFWTCSYYGNNAYVKAMGNGRLDIESNLTKAIDIVPIIIFGKSN